MTDTQRLREIQERVEKAPLTADEVATIRARDGEHRVLRLLATIEDRDRTIAALTREKAESVVTDEAITAEARKIFPDTEPPALAEAFRETFMGGAKYVRAALSAGQAESDTKP